MYGRYIWVNGLGQGQLVESAVYAAEIVLKEVPVNLSVNSILVFMGTDNIERFTADVYDELEGRVSRIGGYFTDTMPPLTVKPKGKVDTFFN